MVARTAAHERRPGAQGHLRLAHTDLMGILQTDALVLDQVRSFLSNDFGIPLAMRPQFKRLMDAFHARGTQVVIA